MPLNPTPLVFVNRYVLSCIFASIIHRCSSDECSEPQKRGNSHEMMMFSNPIANDSKNIDLEAPLVEDHKDRHAKYLIHLVDMCICVV